jgi:SHS2 domain-containing protein
MYESFDHTADLGLRARAANLDTLFADMGLALFSAILEDVNTVRLAEAVTVELAGDDREYLLFDWLKELLYRFEGEHRVFGRFDVRVGTDGLKAVCWGEPFDRDRHAPNHEVKAITLHGLKVVEDDGGWLAEVIVDI